jgi:hypothetical protein
MGRERIYENSSEYKFTRLKFYVYIYIYISFSRYNTKFKLDQSVFAIHDSPLYFEISKDGHPRTVTNARDY